MYGMVAAEQLLRPVRPHPTFAEAISEAVEVATYTPGYILHHLPATALLFVRSIVQNGDHYLRTLVGGSLSYYTLDLAWFWVLALYLLLWYAAVPAQDVPVPGLPQGRYRVWCALAALLCAALAFAGCLVWTPSCRCSCLPACPAGSRLPAANSPPVPWSAACA